MPEPKNSIVLNMNYGSIDDCIGLIQNGIGFHHAGLLNEDRHLVEQLFRNGKIKVLCATSTLAAGVNLPAHLVIIKGTLQYGPHGYQEYSEVDIFQMMGRAGRPQFDSFGVAVIITDHTRESHYANLCEGGAPIESKLHKNLIEHLNSEIVLGTIVDHQTAVQWLKSTYLYVRMTENPSFYEMDRNDVNAKLNSALAKDIERLLEAKLVQSTKGSFFRGSLYGAIMTKFCVKLETMTEFFSLKPNPEASSIVYYCL